MLLTYKEASQRLRIAEITLRKWVSHKRIPYIKIGRAVRFDSEELDRWIRAHTIEMEDK